MTEMTLQLWKNRPIPPCAFRGQTDERNCLRGLRCDFVHDLQQEHYGQSDRDLKTDLLSRLWGEREPCKGASCEQREEFSNYTKGRNRPRTMRAMVMREGATRLNM